MKEDTKTIGEFISTAKKIGAADLLKCSSGNMSCRLNAERIALSRSGSWLGEIEEKDISICNLASGELLKGAKPTIERNFHFGILRARSDVNVVLHFQSPAATVIACLENEISDFNVTAEIPIYIGKIKYVPYLLPGSEKLAKKVTEAMQDCNLVIMKNHGQVVAGKNFQDVLQKAIFFEMACNIILNSANNVRRLTANEIEELSIYKSSK